MATRMRSLGIGAVVLLSLAALASLSSGQESPTFGSADRARTEPASVGETLPEAPGQLLDKVSLQRRLIAAQVRAEVHDVLRSARGQLATQPTAAVRQLKLVLERLDRVAGLSQQEAVDLRAQLVALLREANRQTTAREISDIQEAADRAAAFDRLQASADLDRNQEKIRQLMARLESLLSERQYRSASGLAAGPLAAAASDSTLATSANFMAQLSGGHATNMELRSVRQRAVVGALATAELAHVPFADDEPMVFPRADVWQALSERRAGAAHVDLRAQSPAEARIRQQLQAQTKVDFIETPLSEAAAYLQDLHGITIQLDQKALEDAQVFADVPVTLAVDKVSLRTSLRLLLRPLDLTYVVQDEVLLITTTEVASQQVFTAVYPLGDLALPVQSTGGSFSSPGLSSSSSLGSGFNLPGLNGQAPAGQNNQGPGLPF
jgi:hypothetical protein